MQIYRGQIWGCIWAQLLRTYGRTQGLGTDGGHTGQGGWGHLGRRGPGGSGREEGRSDSGVQGARVAGLPGNSPQGLSAERTQNTERKCCPAPAQPLLAVVLGKQGLLLAGAISCSARLGGSTCLKAVVRIKTKCVGH